MMETFYRDYYRIVYGYLLSLCGDPGEAEELTAETFLKAVEHIGRYDPHYKATTWLCTIGRNLYFSDRKRRRRLRPLDEAEGCAAPSAETMCLQQEEAKQVIAAAKMLPPLQCQVLFMRLQGMKFREIGLLWERRKTGRGSPISGQNRGF